MSAIGHKPTLEVAEKHSKADIEVHDIFRELSACTSDSSLGRS